MSNADTDTDTSLTAPMAEVLELMFYGFEDGLSDPTQAAAEVLGASRSAVAAVARHLVRRGWLERTSEGYTATAQAQVWWMGGEVRAAG